MEETATNLPLPENNGTTPENGNGRFPLTRIRFTLTLTILGFLAFLIGVEPSLFGLDNARTIGFAQIFTMLLGLGLVTWGAQLTLNLFWPRGEKTILADFGSRVVATGYVISVFTALADAFGLGTNPLPDVFLGILQIRELMIGMVVIAIGLLMQVRWQKAQGVQKSSSTPA